MPADVVTLDMTIDEPSPREIAEVISPIAILDSRRFAHMQRVAKLMAAGTLLPDHLYGQSPTQTFSNCFMVVNFSERWNMDPFAVAQATSVVHGKICFEGKLVHAVLMTKLLIDLDSSYSGSGDELTIVVFDVNKPTRRIEGTVLRWRTWNRERTKVNESWRVNPHDMLWYRGVRQWARRYEPAMLLGVYTPDEMEELSLQSREQLRQRSIPPAVRHSQTPAPIAASAGSGEEGAPTETLQPPPGAPSAQHDRVVAHVRGMLKKAQARKRGENAVLSHSTPVQPPSAIRGGDKSLAGPPPAVRRKTSQSSQPPKPKPQDLPQPAPTPTDDPGPNTEPTGRAPLEESLEDLVRQYEEDCTAAQTLEDLDDIEMQLTGVPLGRELANRAEIAWSNARRRIAEASAPPPRINRESEDYKRGRRDRLAGLDKCLNAAIRGDELRMEDWKAGWDEAGGQGRF